ncbi:PAS domain S-box protein [Pseudomonas sp. EpS/L25]|uniref:PAS domain S-box protein n=1 Tax=Pseudomonas sp. EpS/L25 TaxID=1749078 RepID=UPI0007433129|nr:PAS domain S-box protein [Pseudomonas sp. EpS/L25]KUM43631.1 histidine kinase [Pseudomonas sp. EpS/L25]
MSTTPPTSSLSSSLAQDVDLVAEIAAIPRILDTVCRLTGMGFAAVARVTDDRWIACCTLDLIGFGLGPGDELVVESTICDEIRDHRQPVVIDDVAQDDRYRSHHTPRQYGLRSYISVPIVLEDGSFFGTLCAIDPRPAQPSRPEVLATFELFAGMIALEIAAQRRFQAARNVLHSEAFSRSLLKASLDCVKVLSAEGHIEFMNGQGLELNQLQSVDQVLGQEYAALWPEEEGWKIRQAVATAAEGRTTRVEGFCPTARGEPRWWEVSCSPFEVAGSDRPKIICISRDISGRILAEKAQRARTDAMSTLNDDLERQVSARTAERDQIWQCSTDPLCVASLDGFFLSLNPAWVQTLGWTLEELKAEPFVSFVHPDDLAATRQAFGALRQGKPVSNFENRYRHRDGSYRWLSWNAVYNDGLIYATVRDVSEQRQNALDLANAEDALRQSQKMEAIGQLTGGVAHDFNNLLTVIKSSCDLLKRPNLSEERRDRYINAISTTIDRAAKLTGQLLAFARRQALTPEVFSASANVRALHDMLGTLLGSRIQIEVDLPETPCLVYADPGQFDTALVNMAVNARDAMDGAGRLTLAIETVAAIPESPSQAGSDLPAVVMSITDTGSGIAREHLEQIFEPFFTTKRVGQGTGLGLSQVFGFIKQSGGEIRVTSEVGRGTTFRLYLPLVTGEAGPVITSTPPAVADGHGIAVLVVEDNLDVGTFAVASLRDLGYRPELVSSAELALALLAERPGHYDVVFSDVVMPGLSGLELAIEIRRLYRSLPVLLTSGYSHVLATNNAQGFELIHKPYSVEELSRRLQEILEEAAAHWVP